jgi:hypothetical protein
MIDYGTFRGGVTWRRSCIQSISEADVTVLALTRASARSEEVRNETIETWTQGKLVLPVKLRKCRIPQHLDPVTVRDLTTESLRREEMPILLAEIWGQTTTKAAPDRSNVFDNWRVLYRPELPTRVQKALQSFAGRQWVLKEIGQWLDQRGPRTERIFWITGKPGTGKSVVAARLAEDQAAVRACHFFEHPIETDPVKGLRSIAHQLWEGVPGYGDQFTAEQLRYLETETGLQNLLTKLVVRPLTAVGAPAGGSKPFVLVLDAVDEVSEEALQPFILAIREAFADAPEWVRLVMTSRSGDIRVPSIEDARPLHMDDRSDENRNDAGFWSLASAAASRKRPRRASGPQQRRSWTRARASSSTRRSCWGNSAAILTSSTCSGFPGA